MFTTNTCMTSSLCWLHVSVCLVWRLWNVGRYCTCTVQYISLHVYWHWYISECRVVGLTHAHIVGCNRQLCEFVVSFVSEITPIGDTSWINNWWNCNNLIYIVLVSFNVTWPSGKLPFKCQKIARKLPILFLKIDRKLPFFSKIAKKCLFFQKSPNDNCWKMTFLKFWIP